jgi:hypothetical protein
MDYLLLPFVEFEIRFGTNTPNHFDSSIDKKYFEKILTTLETGTWESIKTNKTTEYIKDSLRLINDTSIILKESVIKKDLQLVNSPFDIRLSINQEFTLNSYLNSFNKNDSIVRVKERKSFFDKYSKYDLTVVNQKINGINTTLYEIEFELLVTNETLLWDTSFINDFIRCKIYDIINIVEPLEFENFKISVI